MISLRRAEHRLGELESEPHLGVGADLRPAAAVARAAHLTEERLEDVAQAAFEAEAPAPPPAWAPKTPSGP